MEASKLRNWSKIMLDWQPWSVVTYMLRPQSRWSAKMIAKFKNLLTWATVEKTFMSWENLEEADIENGRAQYLYKAADNYMFMDNDTFEQFEFTTDQLWEQTNYLIDWMEVNMVKWNWNAINIELPSVVTLKVAETEPWLKWNTADWWGKPATLETWAVVQVPFFINAWDSIVINTLTWEYKERAK